MVMAMMMTVITAAAHTRVILSVVTASPVTSTAETTSAETVLT